MRRWLFPSLAAAALLIGIAAAALALFVLDDESEPDRRAGRESTSVEGDAGCVRSADVAVVGSRTISQAALDRLVDQARTTFERQGAPPPATGSQEERVLIRQAMAFLVQRAVVAEKAEELGIEVTDDDVERELDRLKRRYVKGSERRYREEIARQGLTDEQVHEDVRAQLVQARIFKKVTKGVRNKQRRMQRWVAEVKEEFRGKTLYRVGYAPQGIRPAPSC